jgi:hypothetical protein
MYGKHISLYATTNSIGNMLSTLVPNLLHCVVGIVVRRGVDYVVRSLSGDHNYN